MKHVRDQSPWPRGRAEIWRCRIVSVASSNLSMIDKRRGHEPWPRRYSAPPVKKTRRDPLAADCGDTYHVVVQPLDTGGGIDTEPSTCSSTRATSRPASPRPRPVKAHLVRR